MVKERGIYMAPKTYSAQHYDLSFSLKDTESFHRIRSEVYCDDQFIGLLILDWFQLPFPKNFPCTTQEKLYDLLKKLAARGHAIREAAKNDPPVETTL
jgi:hypothetical protein